MNLREKLARLEKTLPASRPERVKRKRPDHSRLLPGARKFTEMGITARKDPPRVEQIERATRHVESQKESASG